MADNEMMSTGVDVQDSKDHLMDIDRMVNEGLGGGYVTRHNGLIDENSMDSLEED
jgi:hypothetical protein